MEHTELYDRHAIASGAISEIFRPNERSRRISDWLLGVPEICHKPDLRLLEIGFGDANLSLTLARSLPRAHVDAVDISLSRVEQARKVAARESLSDRLHFESLDVDAGLTAIESNSADAIVSIDVLEHVFDVFGFVQNIGRIVRTDGFALLRVPNIAYAKHRAALLFGKLPVTSSWFGPANDFTAWRSTWGWDGGHLHYFTKDTLAGLLKGAGLEPIRWGDPGSTAEFARQIVPSLLLGNLCVLARRK